VGVTACDIGPVCANFYRLLIYLSVLRGVREELWKRSQTGIATRSSYVWWSPFAWEMRSLPWFTDFSP